MRKQLSLDKGGVQRQHTKHDHWSHYNYILTNSTGKQNQCVPSLLLSERKVK